MTVDAARVELLLAELRLPSMKAIWPRLAAQSDEEGWPAAKFLATLAEHEAADRSRRRFERHLFEARLPPGKTLAAFDFEVTPMVSKAQIMALTSGDIWLKSGANLFVFGPLDGDKSHLAAAIDRLVHHATILEMNVQSYRRKTAVHPKRGPGWPPSHATPKEFEKDSD